MQHRADTTPVVSSVPLARRCHRGNAVCASGAECPDQSQDRGGNGDDGEQDHGVPEQAVGARRHVERVDHHPLLSLVGCLDILIWLVVTWYPSLTRVEDTATDTCDASGVSPLR